MYNKIKIRARGDVGGGAGELDVELDAAFVVPLEVDVGLGLVQPDPEACADLYINVICINIISYINIILIQRWAWTGSAGSRSLP